MSIFVLDNQLLLAVKDDDSGLLTHFESEWEFRVFIIPKLAKEVRLGNIGHSERYLSLYSVYVERIVQQLGRYLTVYSTGGATDPIVFLVDTDKLSRALVAGLRTVVEGRLYLMKSGSGLSSLFWALL